jgi:hypothetical protein
MRVLLIVTAVALTVGGYALVAAKPEKADQKLNYRELVTRLAGWAEKQKEAGSLEKADAKKLEELVKSFETLTAQQLYEGLSAQERKKLKKLLDEDERLEGYAGRVAKVADDVGLGPDDTDALLRLYTAYRESYRDDWSKRDEAWKTFEKNLAKAVGRAKAKKIANSIRRNSGRGGR